MKDYWEEPKRKSLDKKKMTIIICTIILIALFIVIGVLYRQNRPTRNWIDRNILQKEKTQNNLPSIELGESRDTKIYAFNKYIGLLSKNIFDIYDSTGKKQKELKLEITKPIFASNNRYLVVAEEKGKKLYVIEDKEIIWEKDIEGNISAVTVNKNGYVAVNIVDTSYKTVIAMFDNQGEQLFNTYLSTTRVVATSISNDNKYLAIAELDTSGTILQSNIKVISIEEGKNDPTNSIKKIYNGENNELVTNIKYQDKNKLLCMYNDKITLIKEDEAVETLQEYEDKKTDFASIDLSNAIVTVEEKPSGIFTVDSIVNIINSENKSSSIYNTDSITKEVYTKDNIIALNLGSEVEFVNNSGWLVKKYVAEQEITSIVISNAIAGIVYRDKIEIINL